MAQKYLFIAISFYLNIVCKNIVFDVNLNQAQSDHIVEQKFFCENISV